jgi:molybdopterin molybdotransferase
MAQLSDDCFAFGGPMMSVDEAVALITSRLTAVSDVETVALVEADGRTLAADLIAPLPLPPFTNSAVDGYALASSDLPTTTPQTFPVSGRVQAGASAPRDLGARQAVRIFTGAPMPQGFDTVFMQEDVMREDVETKAGNEVVLPPGLKAGANVRPAGEDVQMGAVALRAGTRLRPQDVALIAAFGLTSVSVRRRLRVAVFSTGDEVVAPGAPRSAVQLFDSNRFMLGALLSRLGCSVGDFGIARDDRAALAVRLKQAASTHDLILTSGGVSTGEEDHVKAGVESAGKLVLWRMAIKPGRPVAMGVIDGVPLIGLPGNPVASFVTFVHVVHPAIAVLSGGLWRKPVAMPVRAAFDYKKKIARREYVRVHLRTAADGVLEAVKFPREGAGLLSSLVETDGLVELREDITQVEAGQTVGYLSYATLI